MNPSKTLAVISCILALALGCAVTGMFRAQREQRDLNARNTLREREVLGLNDVVNATTNTAQQLEAKLGQVTAVLTDSVRQLTEMRSLYAEAQSQLATTRGELDRLNGTAKSGLVDIPAPVITRSTTDGKARVVFPSLVSKRGVLIGKDQEFSSRLGRNVVFKDGDGRRLRVEISDLPIEILKILGIDSVTADKEQRELDARSAQFDAAARNIQANHAASLAQERKEQRERDAAMAIEMAKIDEERRRAMADENIRRQAADAASTQAQASLRAADAALSQAMNPPPVVNFYPGAQSQPASGGYRILWGQPMYSPR